MPAPKKATPSRKVLPYVFCKSSNGGTFKGVAYLDMYSVDAGA